MKKQELFEKVTEEYGIVELLSDKNGAKSFVLKHKSRGKKIVFRLFEDRVAVYDYLKSISFYSLPEVYDSIVLEDGQAVFEEYIGGLTVDEALENGTFSYKAASKIMYSLCDALAVIHSHGFVHRDIKPQNVMICNGGNAKLIDFNASRAVKQNAQKDTVAIGTIGYASPEQLGLSQSGPATDIYAMGVLLNVMLTNEHPSKKTAQGRAKKIVMKCTGIAPGERYKSVEKLKTDM